MKFVNLDAFKKNQKYDTNEKLYSSRCNCRSCNCNCGSGGSPTTKCSKQAKISMTKIIEKVYK